MGQIHVSVTRRIPLQELSEKEKTNLAKKVKRKNVLYELARDESVNVKLALFSNDCLSQDVVIKVLEKDNNEAVQRAVTRYWEDIAEQYSYYLYIIEKVFPNIVFPDDLKKRNVRTAIMATFYLLLGKYEEYLEFYDEQGKEFHFSKNSNYMESVWSASIEKLINRIIFLYNKKPEVIQENLEFKRYWIAEHDTTYQLRIEDFKKWFDNIQLSEKMEPLALMTRLGLAAFLKDLEMPELEGEYLQKNKIEAKHYIEIMEWVYAWEEREIPSFRRRCCND